MNDLLAFAGLQGWKPLAGALLLPPVPCLVLVVAGAACVRRRARLGSVLLLLGIAGVWFGATVVAGDALERLLLRVPPPLSPDRIEALRRDGPARAATAIVVLGGGVRSDAPEYGTSSLDEHALERLRYGLWLARRTGLPVAFTGGRGWAERGDAAEAEVASRIAAEEFGRPLRWTEGASRDTRENAVRTAPLLRRDGIAHVLLVTHGWHMPRAQKHFEAAGLRVEPAPMALTGREPVTLLDWCPSARGFETVRHALREALGALAGA